MPRTIWHHQCWSGEVWNIQLKKLQIIISRLGMCKIVCCESSSATGTRFYKVYIHATPILFLFDTSNSHVNLGSVLWQAVYFTFHCYLGSLFRLHFVLWELSEKFLNSWKCLFPQQDLFSMSEIMVSLTCRYNFLLLEIQYNVM